MTAQDVHTMLLRLGDTATAAHSQRFFKTGPGEYGEGDQFLGIRVPILRAQVKQCRDLPLKEVLIVLRSAFHEERLLALLILVDQFAKGNEENKTRIYESYLQHTAHINNWDLVDSSAPHIVGAYLEQRNKQPLYTLAASTDLWERRIAIMATFHMIRKKDFDDALAISRLLSDDREDLIHKAVGWMLREIGKRDLTVERAFLQEHYQQMPRTMLRYAIEKFPEEERKRYLQGEV
ncbi:MAG: DNA alkylation repair protein [Chloroflexota bacterium]